MNAQFALVLCFCIAVGVMAEKKDPCEVGSIFACQIHCLIQGELYGTCGAENKCKCAGGYYEAGSEPNKRPCETGAGLGCTIHCILAGSYFGHCDPENNCICA